MIREIAIYVEGGGGGKARDLFRNGMSTFLRPVRELARKKRIGFKVIACGGRSEAYEAFVNALRIRPNRHCILLVDSEAAVGDACSPWAHLRNQQRDGWERPGRTMDEQCQMMVVCMENWFLADPDGLAGYFGNGFDVSQLPPAEHAERMNKDVVAIALQRATRNTRAREYHKIRDGVKLLEKIDPKIVRTHCKWCDRLFVTLENLINN